ncbi:MAG: ferrochelatase [Sphingobacteriia bacterium 28-36-52]|nr:MAG: ferrochelatase [Sphingobacteriia bacterium 28-36-52]
MSKKGILLMNLGSPNSPSVSDVKIYLKEFLMDEKVIDIPFILRTLLVKGIIVPFRSPKSAHAYQSIWTKEGSPLLVNTYELQHALSSEIPELVEVCMRYGHPHPSQAFDSLMQNIPDLEEVILFPLYPHYAMSSFETAVEYAQQIHKEKNYPFKLTTIPPYYNNTYYINALADSIAPFLKNPFDKLLLSYHGVPERHIKKGDITLNHCLKVKDCCNVSCASHEFCYRHQTFETTNLVANKLGLAPNLFEQTFQSRLGQDKWLTPYTAARLKELPAEGVKNLLIACPAFVSDCLETLEEIAEEGKEIFLKAGGESFTMIPCLNAQSTWINAVDQIINSYR